jgi:hypothetical protein
MDRMVERANRCYRWHDMVASTSVRGERRGCESMLQESSRAAKLENEKGRKKVVKKWPGLTPNWRRPRRQDTKMRSLWPDLEMIARGEGTRVGGREMRFGESWGTFAAKTHEYSGFSKRPDRQKSFGFSTKDLAFLTAATPWPDAPSPFDRTKKSPTSSVDDRWLNSTAQMLLFIALFYLLQGKLKEALSDRVALPPYRRA